LVSYKKLIQHAKIYGVGVTVMFPVDGTLGETLFSADRGVGEAEIPAGLTPRRLQIPSLSSTIAIKVGSSG
jgi:hypothetical protein